MGLALFSVLKNGTGGQPFFLAMECDETLSNNSSGYSAGSIHVEQQGVTEAGEGEDVPFRAIDLIGTTAAFPRQDTTLGSAVDLPGPTLEFQHSEHAFDLFGGPDLEGLRDIQFAEETASAVCRVSCRVFSKTTRSTC